MFKTLGEMIRVPENKPNEPTISSFTFKCSDCDEGGWCSETELVIHKKTSHKQEIGRIVREKDKNVCLSCLMTFPDKKKLFRHFKSQHFLSSSDAKRIEREIFVCDICNEIFFNKRLLELHISNRHLHLSELICPVCFKCCKPKTIWRHVDSHQMHSVSVCPICLQKQNDRQSLCKHICSHQRYYNCDICGFSTKEEKSFNEHIAMYTKGSTEEMQYETDFIRRHCVVPSGKINWRCSVWRSGYRGLVLANELYICILCRHICSSEKMFSRHLHEAHLTEPNTRHTAPQPTTTKYLCSCNEMFTKNVFLKQHVLKMKEPHRAVDYKTIEMSHKHEPEEEETTFVIVLDESESGRIQEETSFME